jgi:hypothetical protein
MRRGGQGVRTKDVERGTGGEDPKGEGIKGVRTNKQVLRSRAARARSG